MSTVLIHPVDYRVQAASSTRERATWKVTDPSIQGDFDALLHGDPGALSLLASNPFPDAPPRFVRACYYRYHFAPPGNPDGAWWTRTLLGDWLPPLAADDARLQGFLRAHGWR